MPPLPFYRERRLGMRASRPELKERSNESSMPTVARIGPYRFFF
jgi:hypothetical protein